MSGVPVASICTILPMAHAPDALRWPQHHRTSMRLALTWIKPALGRHRNVASVRRTVSIRAAFGGWVPRKRFPGSGMRAKKAAPLSGS